MYKITQTDTGVSFKTRAMRCDPRLPGIPMSSGLPYRSGHQMLFCGPSGSGKTSLMMALLTGKHLYRKTFDTILVYMPPSSRASLPQQVLDGLEYPPFDELTPDTLSQGLDIVESNAADDPPLNSLIIFDDVTAALKDHSILKALTHLSFSRRHLRTSIWMLSQTLVSVPLQLRRNFTHLVLYRPRNNRELEGLWTEFVSSRAEAEALSAAAWQEPFDALIVHTETGDLWRISANRIFRLKLDPR